MNLFRKKSWNEVSKTMKYSFGNFSLPNHKTNFTSQSNNILAFSRDYTYCLCQIELVVHAWYLYSIQNIILESFDRTFQDFFWKLRIGIGLIFALQFSLSYVTFIIEYGFMVTITYIRIEQQLVSIEFNRKVQRFCSLSLFYDL